MSIGCNNNLKNGKNKENKNDSNKIEQIIF